MSDHFQENRLALLPSSEEKPALACPKVNSSLTDLVCAACGVEHPSDRPQNLCTRCGKPLSAQYDLVRASRTLTKAALQTRERSLWRYSEELPLRSQSNRVSLGEGWTPLLSADRLAARIGLEILYIKDESLNPTGSFKARGMAVAVSKAKELGISKLAAPSAGNAAGALAAYAARAGLEAHLFMPLDTPRANVVECERTGAHVTLMKGLITDCGAEVARRKDAEGWFDVSTLKEPYRLEGKKTLGYELAEQLGWVLPDVILYPTGGGTGLIGMWKAFEELERLGWIGSKRPRMFTVQAEGCAPIVRAFESGAKYAAEFPNAHTLASGLRVPKAIGDFMILEALRSSGGGAVAVSDESMAEAATELGSSTGIFAAPEGAACYAALKGLLSRGSIKSGESTVIFNTGSGLKYLEFCDRAR
jgi:threonine synthase